MIIMMNFGGHAPSSGFAIASVAPLPDNWAEQMKALTELCTKSNKECNEN